MRLFRFSIAILMCGGLMACGGSKAKPVVQPNPAPSPCVVAEVKQELPPEQTISLSSDTNRYSYALGMDLGKALVNINVPVKMDVVLRALQDVVDTNRDMLMTDVESERVLQELLQLIQNQKDEETAKAAHKALEDQAAFLAKNIQGPKVRVTTKGVQYIVLKEGKGLSPKLSDRVRVHFAGSLLNGVEFDNSVKRGEPLEFPLGAVIEGWQDLLLVMKEGMKVKAWIPSALAYGEKGAPPTIPANALLVFEVELLKVLVDGPGR